jgi:hypothetical protein
VALRWRHQRESARWILIVDEPSEYLKYTGWAVTKLSDGTYRAGHMNAWVFFNTLPKAKKYVMTAYLMIGE